MKSLFDYDIIINDVFYRGFHILNYLEKHKDLSLLDKEVISNTIMDALVENNLIDENSQSLDLDNLTIRNDLLGFKYNKNSNVTSFPLWFKEKMRSKILLISGNLPVSVFLSKPAGGTSFCLYDPCTAISSLFDEWELIDVIYDSPTRLGYRLREDEKRPFLSVNIDGRDILIDVLLNRFYDKEWFTTTYNMKIINSTSSKKVSNNKVYLEQVKETNNLFGDSLFMLNSLIMMIPDGNDMDELKYELEKSKDYFPDAWIIMNSIQEDFNLHKFF